MSLPELHRLVRRIERVLLGTTGQTPTPTILRIFDVGMLRFLNEKQAALHQVVTEAPPGAADVLPPLRSLLEFTTYIVGMLIVEAERIDAAVIDAQRELSEMASELRRHDLELQYRRRHTGSTVAQTIARHYNTRVIVPDRRNAAMSDQIDPAQQEELHEQTAAIAELRAAAKRRKLHLRVLLIVQQLLHGRPGVPQLEASAVIADTGVLVAFRKCSHRIRDAMYDAREDERLGPVQTLLDFITYLDCGITAASDDLEACAIALKRDVVAFQKDARLAALAQRSTRNKAMSASAARHNATIGRGVLSNEGWRRQQQQEEGEGEGGGRGAAAEEEYPVAPAAESSRTASSSRTAPGTGSFAGAHAAPPAAWSAADSLQRRGSSARSETAMLIDHYCT